MQNKILQASFLVALSGILYGFLGYLGTGVIQENTSISTMLFWRFLIAGSWMLLFASKTLVTERVFHINKQTLFSMFLLGAIGYAGSSAFYFIACQYTGTGVAMVIFFSYPIIIAVYSWLMHRQAFNFKIVFLLMLMMAGLFLLRDTNAQSVDIMGIVFGIIAATCYAFYVMGSKQIASYKINSSILTTVVCFGCAFICFLFSIYSHTFVLPVSIKSWAYLLALGILATALPIQLMLEGLKYISSMRASIISVLEPLVTVLVGIVLLEESISSLQLLGAAMILGSALLVQFQREL